jgi:hypothetical protein
LCAVQNQHDNGWLPQADGSRARKSNGIRMVDRTTRPESERADIEHLVTWREESGRVVVLGLDDQCRPVYMTTLFAYH